MRNSKLFILILTISACKESNQNNVCYTDLKSKNEICWIQDSSLRIVKNSKTNDIYEIYTSKRDFKFRLLEFQQRDNRFVKKMLLNQSSSEFETTVFFDSIGNIKRIAREDFKFNEMIYLDKMPWGIKITVCSILKNEKDFLKTSEFSIDKSGDTFNYFYYKKDKYGFNIFSDYEDLDLDRDDLDSIEITYTTENLQNMDYQKIDEIIYVPEFGSRKKIRILNSFRIKTNSEEIKGEIWGYFKKDPPYSYHPLILHGDISIRVTQFMSYTKNIMQTYNGKFDKNNKLVQELMSTGIFRMESGKLILIK